MSNHAVLCGDCKAECQVVREEDGAERVRCPQCLKTATREEALASAGKYVRDVMATQLSASLKKAAAGSKFLTYKPGRRSSAKHEWILEGV